MQRRDIHDSYAARAEYYAAHLLNHYTKKGVRDADIPKVYQISVVNFIVNQTSESSCCHYALRLKTGESLADRLNVIFLEVPKMKQLSKDVSKLTAVELWGKFFYSGEHMDLREFVSEAAKYEPGIKCAMDVLEFLSEDEAQWQKQWSHEKYLFDMALAEKDARARGKEIGLAEGRAEGLAEGRAEGRAEGHVEGVKAASLKNAVTAVKEFNLDPETVSLKFGVPLEELKKNI